MRLPKFKPFGESRVWVELLSPCLLVLIVANGHYVWHWPEGCPLGALLCTIGGILLALHAQRLCGEALWRREADRQRMRALDRAMARYIATMDQLMAAERDADGEGWRRP